MEKNIIMYESTREDILKAKKKLSKGILLTEEETKLLQQMVGELPDEDIILETTNERGKGMNIDKLVKEFNDYAKVSSEKLEAILAVISEGKIPDKTYCVELDNAISQLRNKYESISQLAISELLEDEIPEEGSSVATYYEAFKSSKSAVLKGKLQKIEKILAKFLSVQSLVVKYTIALEPLQKVAKALVERIDNGEIADIEEIEEKVAGPELFMKALECEDLNTDEGNDMLDALIDNFNYPLYVTRGLLSKSYFIPNSQEEKENEGESNKSQPEVSISGSSEEKVSSDEIKAETNDGDEHEVIEEDAKEEAEPKSEESVKEHSEFRKAIEEKAVALEKSEFGILSKEISTAETKKLSASVFSNDMRKGNVKALKTIIQQLSNFMVLSPELMKMRYNMPLNVTEGSLDFLQKKGYIRKYKIMPGGEFYCSSPRLEMALTYKDAAKFAGVRQLHADTMDELIEDTSSSASARMTLLKLYTNTALNYIKSDIRQSSSNNMVMTEAFVYRTYDSTNPDDVEFLAGAFWTNYNEADDFAENVKKILDESKNIISFVFAAINKDVAKRIMDEIVKMAPDKLNKNIFLYSAGEERYYSYETGEEVKIEDIWTFLAKENEETEEVVGKENSKNTEELSAIKEEVVSELEKKVAPIKKSAELIKGISAVETNQEQNSIIHEILH